MLPLPMTGASCPAAPLDSPLEPLLDFWGALELIMETVLKRVSGHMLHMMPAQLSICDTLSSLNLNT